MCEFIFIILIKINIKWNALHFDLYQLNNFFMGYIYNLSSWAVIDSKKINEMNNNIFYTSFAVCTSQNINQEIIDEMVSWGIAHPRGDKPEKWLFTHDDLERIARAQRFRNDLGINIPGAAFALELIEEVIKLRKKER